MHRTSLLALVALLALGHAASAAVNPAPKPEIEPVPTSREPVIEWSAISEAIESFISKFTTNWQDFKQERRQRLDRWLSRDEEEAALTSFERRLLAEEDNATTDTPSEPLSRREEVVSALNSARTAVEERTSEIAEATTARASDLAQNTAARASDLAQNTAALASDIAGDVGGALNGVRRAAVNRTAAIAGGVRRAAANRTSGIAEEVSSTLDSVRNVTVDDALTAANDARKAATARLTEARKSTVARVTNITAEAAKFMQERVAGKKKKAGEAAVALEDKLADKKDIKNDVVKEAFKLVQDGQEVVQDTAAFFQDAFNTVRERLQQARGSIIATGERLYNATSPLRDRVTIKYDKAQLRAGAFLEDVLGPQYKSVFGVLGNNTSWDMLTRMFDISGPFGDNFSLADLVPRDLDDLVDLIREERNYLRAVPDFIDAFCDEDLIEEAEKIPTRCIGPTVELRLRPQVCTLDSISKVVVCDPAKLVLTTTPTVCNKKFLRAFRFRGKECRPFRATFGFESETTLGGQSFDVVLRDKVGEAQDIAADVVTEADEELQEFVEDADEDFDLGEDGAGDLLGDFDADDLDDATVGLAGDFDFSEFASF